MVQHFVSFIDTTRHRAEQAQSRMLINELNHRVKNTPSTVQSIVSQASPRGVPFLFATGYVGDDVRDGYRDRSLLRKPFRPNALADVLTGFFPGDAG